MTQKEVRVVLVRGATIKGRWGEWHRHDEVKIDGRELEGCIQVSRKYIRLGSRRHEMETITCFRGSCVLGKDLKWLAKMNGILVEKDHAGRWLLKAASPEEVARAD